jgi:hypothetical protein
MAFQPLYKIINFYPPITLRVKPSAFNLKINMGFQNITLLFATNFGACTILEITKMEAPGFFRNLIISSWNQNQKILC